jgi:hypothetical protein
MSEGDSLVVVGLFFSITIYFLFSTLDLPTLLGSERRLPAILQLVHASLADAFWRRGRSRERVVVEFLTVLIATQVVPVIVLAQPQATAAVRTASVVELVLALSWTILLVVVGSRRQ